MKNKYLFIIICVLSLSIFLFVLSWGQGDNRWGEFESEIEKEKSRFELERQKSGFNELLDIEKERSKIKKEVEDERERIKREIAEEKEKILKVWKSEREAIKNIWGGYTKSTSIDVSKTEVVNKSTVSYKDGSIQVTGFALVGEDGKGDENEAKRKASDFAKEELRDTILDIKPTNKKSVGETIDDKDTKITTSQVDNYLDKNVQVKEKDIKDLPDGQKGVYITVSIPMHGEQGIEKLVEPMVEKEEEGLIEGLNVPSKKKVEDEIEEKPESKVVLSAYQWTEDNEPFNGLIVNTQGKNYIPCISPRVVCLDVDGKLKDVYSKELIKPENERMGINGWALSVPAAKTEPRLTPGQKFQGDPLLIGKGEVEKIKDNRIYLKPEAANKIIIANQKYQFLNVNRVVIVVD